MSTLPSTIRVDEKAQFTLFDLGPDLSELDEALEEIMVFSQAANTVRAYSFSWKAFAAWCRENAQEALPASPETLSRFVVWACVKRKPRRYKLTRVRHIVAAIKSRHRAEGLPDPVDDRVRGALAAIARKIDQDPGGKDALTPDHLRRAVAGLPDNGVGVRDRAILLVGFTTGWRGSELVGLHFHELRFFSDHALFRLRRSKTDQEGKGREVRIPRIPESPLCPVAALEAWIKIRGTRPGALFWPFSGGRHMTLREGQLRAKVVCAVVQKALKRAGIKQGNWGGHSLRSGMITAAAENGADVIAIQERTGHKRLETIAKYVRSAGGFRRDPLAGVL
jgi:site-specific recombinase XerD